MALSKVDRFEALLDLLAEMSEADTTSWAIRLVGQDICSWDDFEDAIESRAIEIHATLDPAYPPTPGVADWERQGYEAP